MPSPKIIHGNGNRFSYYFSVYVSISKSYSNAPARKISAKADAKVHIFCEPAKYYATFFHQQRRFSKKRTNNEKRKTSLPYYIYTQERFVLFRTCFNHRLPVPYDTVLPQGSYVDKRCLSVRMSLWSLHTCLHHSATRHDVDRDHQQVP